MKNKTFYNNALYNEKTEIKQVGWENEEKAVARYKAVAKFIPQGTNLVCDYGCGLATFRKYLPENVKYIGIDSHEPYVEKINNLHPELHVLHTKVNGIIPKCDTAVSIGVWTLRDGVNDNSYWNDVEMQATNMLKSVSHSLIINGFHNQVDYQDPKLYYHDIGKWIKYANQQGVRLYFYVFAKYEFVMMLKKNK